MAINFSPYIAKFPKLDGAHGLNSYHLSSGTHFTHVDMFLTDCRAAKLTLIPCREALLRDFKIQILILHFDTLQL